MPFSLVDHGVTEEEPAKEPEDPYRKQEAAAAAAAYESEGKFHRPLRERLHPCEYV